MYSLIVIFCSLQGDGCFPLILGDNLSVQQCVSRGREQLIMQKDYAKRAICIDSKKLRSLLKGAEA